MHRPVMNPTLFEEEPTRRGGACYAGRRLLGFAARILLGLFRGSGRVMLFEPLAHTRLYRRGVEPPGVISPAFRGLLYRLLALPLIVAGSAAVVVWAATHPPHVQSDVDPLAVGAYYDPVDCLTSDGVRLEAWLVPVLDA